MSEISRLTRETTVARSGATQPESGTHIYAFVVSSSCQMYSGTGAAMFDFAETILNDFRVVVIMDVGNPRNVNIARDRCRQLGIEFVASRTKHVPTAPDNGVADALAWISVNRPRVVELISWASALTNSIARQIKETGATLVFTPHLQPMWTLPNAASYTAVGPVLEKSLLFADLVCADSHVEKNAILEVVPSCSNVIVADLGIRIGDSGAVDTDRRRRVVCVADFAEHRKRPDLLMRVLESVGAKDSDLSFALIGRSSDALTLPSSISDRCDAMGYVDEATKLDELRRSMVFVSVSNFEAFGIPIAEALGSGLQVVMTRTDVVAELFGHMPGVSIADGEDPESIADVILGSLRNPTPPLEVAQAARLRFGFPHVYEKKKSEVQRLLAEVV